MKKSNVLSTLVALCFVTSPVFAQPMMGQPMRPDKQMEPEATFPMYRPDPEVVFPDPDVTFPEKPTPKPAPKPVHRPDPRKVADYKRRLLKEIYNLYTTKAPWPIHKRSTWNKAADKLFSIGYRELGRAKTSVGKKEAHVIIKGYWDKLRSYASKGKRDLFDEYKDGIEGLFRDLMKEAGNMDFKHEPCK